MDSFNEYEQATIKSEGRDKPAPAAPELPGPTSPTQMPNKANKSRSDVSGALNWLRVAALALLLLLLTIATIVVSILAVKYALAFAPPPMKPEPLKVHVTAPKPKPIPVPTQYITNPINTELEKKVRKLNGQNTWLRKLLKEARAERSSDEKYHRVLKYAIDQFYERPFRADENSRTICFTTDKHDPKCWSVDRPEGYTLREPDKLSPARPTKVGGMR